MNTSNSNGQLSAAVFDLGGVVMNIRLERIASHWAKFAPPGCMNKLLVALNDPVYLGFELGTTTPQQFHSFMQGCLGCEIDYDSFYDGWNSIFDGAIDGIEELLAELSRHVRLVALSNTNTVHEQQFRMLYPSALAHFEQVFLSNRLGMRKPQPQIYQHVLDYLALPAAKVVFIDDTLINVQAAQDFGMKAILAKSTAQVAQALRTLGVRLGRHNLAYRRVERDFRDLRD